MNYKDDRNWDDPQYKKWRSDVYRRDCYSCQYPNCTAKGFKSKIQAHHIKRWADFPELRFVLSNGITLCKVHHQLIDKQELLYEGMFTNIVNNKKASKKKKKSDNAGFLKMKLFLHRKEDAQQGEEGEQN